MTANQNAHQTLVTKTPEVQMRIGILTGGGDVPGLNPCIKAVVTAATENGWEVVGFRRGWAGPLNYNPEDPERSAEEWLIPLDKQAVRTIDRTGGTMLHTSRTNPSKVRKKDMPAFLADDYKITEEDQAVDCTPHILNVVDALGLDVMIAIGGDDTLSYAARLNQEGVRTMAIPKTMDNDVFGTDFCIGFSTAVSRSVEFIHALRTPTGSHERIAVVELFGRYSGETSLIAGYLAGVERVLISEVPFDVDKVADFLMRDRLENPSNYAMVVVSEGARISGGERIERGETDAYGHRKLGGIGQILGEELKVKTGLGIVGQTLGYLMRSGAPDSLDLMVSMSYATMAVQQIAKGESGRMMALKDGNYTTVPIDTCISGEKRVDTDALYDVENYRPKIRDVYGKPMFLY